MDEFWAVEEFHGDKCAPPTVDLGLSEDHFEARIRDVTVADCTVSIQELQNDGVMAAVGAELWSAAEILSHFLLSSNGLLEPSHRVLEVGAGVGLVGLLAARKGATVTITDVVPELISNLHDTVAKNASRHGEWPAQAPAVSKLDWNDFSPRHEVSEATATEHYDLIIGSELCYVKEHQVLADVLSKLLPPIHEENTNAKIEIGDARVALPAAVIVQRADRSGWQPFLMRCAHLGLKTGVTPIADVPLQLVGHQEWDSAYVLCTVTR